MIVEVELNVFELMLQSGESPNKIPTISRLTTYRGDYDRKKLRRNSKIGLASEVTGQTLSDVCGFNNPCETPPQPLEILQKKVDIPKGAILEALETIYDVCDALENT